MKTLIPFLILATLITLVTLGVGFWWRGLVLPSSPSIPTPTPVATQSSASISTDLILLDSPQLNQTITSPLKITGQARGTWFFEASFPVILTNWDGLIIAEGMATAQGDWMTEEFVPFETELEFVVPEYGDRGTLILKKSNPSGLPENDDALEIPIMFAR